MDDSESPLYLGFGGKKAYDEFWQHIDPEMMASKIDSPRSRVALWRE
jgi:hypothetical protein